MPLWAIKLLLWAGLAASLTALAYGCYEHVYQKGYKAAEAEHQARMAALKAAHLEAVRDIEKREQQRYDEREAQWEQERADAEAVAERVASDLRAGNLRLRQHWQGCESVAGRVPAASDATGQPDDGARLRETSAGRIIRVGAECDARIRALQDLLR